ncbi:MAG: bifunctional 2-C-methyl-D-erythritol 4-phosphate cytidylyltransferase/2-C-methyl-D-erythritol 2,4-cyclodiphosphate synthase [Campylobacterales bacterium]|nr:bifunctional 2-C-methyl-D-erythritol 4-phosphate cytidylyltransferase/2-C-methyl-D-erythritol 2,4-cyclodiphosphate synthase [Campylobacterales bacterium]
MPDLSLVMLGAGSSTRFGLSVKKQWLRIGCDPLWLVATNRLLAMHPFAKIVVVAPKAELSYMRHFGEFTFCEGGDTRQDSLKAALAHVQSEHVMVSDIARACIPQTLFTRLIGSAGCADVIVPALKIADTAFFQDDPIDRNEVRLIQTPQLSRTKALKEALKSAVSFTDDSSAIKANGGTAWYVEGDERAHKLTFAGDLAKLSCLDAPSPLTFTGNGFDVHAFSDTGPMMLGGVEVSQTQGFKAHSDGDVALHALTDAILGAACAGDIGEFFPDTDPAYKGADSGVLLGRVMDFVKSVGFEMVHCDITIIAQTPKLGAFKEAMRHRIASLVGLSPSLVNVKATTTEHLGFVGRNEGVAVSASATLKFYDWTRA